MTDDLRTALTKLAVKYENLGNDDVAADAVWCDLMNLPWDTLAAHPAPEMQAQARICPTCHDDHTAHQRYTPAPASDTRREDVARAEVVREVERHVIDPDTEDCSCGATRLGVVGFPTRAEHMADAVLTVLPAPPVEHPTPVSDTRREDVARRVEADLLHEDLPHDLPKAPDESLLDHTRRVAYWATDRVLTVLPAPPVEHPTPVPDTRREDVAREFEYRLRTVAAYYRLRGKRGEDPDPTFIAREIQGGTERVLAVLPAPTVERDPKHAFRCQCGHGHTEHEQGSGCLAGWTWDEEGIAVQDGCHCQWAHITSPTAEARLRGAIRG